MSIIGGVPEGFSTGAATLTYQNATDPLVQEQFGVDFGCSSVVNGEAQDAVPPVRLREFAEAFYSPVEGYTSNLFSICADDYAPALEAVVHAEVVGAARAIDQQRHDQRWAALKILSMRLGWSLM